MNKKSKIAVGVIGGTTLGIILRKLFIRKPKITKRGQQFAKAIDERIKEDKTDLEQTKRILEEQLKKVNANLEKLD